MDSEEVDERLRALAHPARREIIRLTAGRPVPAGELAAALGLAPATVSEHLKVLRKTGFVVLSAQGQWRRYQAVPGHLAELRAWLDDYQHQIEQHQIEQHQIEQHQIEIDEEEEA